MLKKSSTIISEAQALRKKAEDKLKKELNITGSSENGSAVKYLHELQVHQIELELQNEELLNTKEELETAIKRYDDFYDFAPVGYFSFDAKGTILEVNLTGSTMLNLDRSNLVGLKFQKFISKESLNYFTLILMKVFGEKIKGSCEVYINPEEDLSFYAHLQFSAPIAGTKCHAVVTDITETKRVANDLSQTRNYLEQLINYASAPIIVWNPASEIVVFNKSFERLTGFKTQEVINKKLDFLFPDPSQERSKAKIRQTLNGDFLEGIEIPILCKSGDVKIVLWNSANIYDNENRTLISTIAQGNDITSRKKAENALLESQRKLELALENGNIGIWEFDVRTKKFLFDGRMNKMISLGNSPFDRSFKAFERLIKDEDVKHVNEAFRRTVVDHEPFESILRVMSDEGGEKYLIFKGKLYEDEGEPSRIIGVSFDITGMKKGSEQTLFKLNEELTRSNKDLEHFAYVISHDLQEPLRMVSNFTQLLNQRYGDKLDENARDYIKFAVEGSERMFNLINGLLAYSKINLRGKEFRMVDINGVLDEVVKNLRYMIEKKMAAIKIVNMPALYADRSQMIQLFQNLVSNSIKFSPDSPKITVNSEEQDEFYLFSVKDEGIGIEEQFFERIFQIFQRIDRVEEYEGTGIGLSVCKRIVERHGGRIWIESKRGTGSTFWFTIKKWEPANP